MVLLWVVRMFGEILVELQAAETCVQVDYW